MIPCMDCIPCRKKQYEMCRQYSYLGSRRNGGFAGYAVVPAANLISLSDSVSFEEAAMLEPMAVAVHAIRRVAPKPSETVAVCGLGTIGFLLILFLREAGVKNILAVGNKGFQKQMLEKLGLPGDAWCDNREQNPGQWLRERTEGAGADVFFECVGKNETLTWAVDQTAPGGQSDAGGKPVFRYASGKIRIQEDSAEPTDSDRYMEFVVFISGNRALDPNGGEDGRCIPDKTEAFKTGSFG